MRSFIFTLALATVLTATGCLKNSPVNDLLGPSSDKVAAAPMAQVSDFVTTYKENSVKANKDYAGKWVKITGKIAAISKMKSIVDGRTYYLVDLNDKDGKVSERIVCRFNFNKQDEVAELKQGSIVVFYGRIDDLNNIIHKDQHLPMIIDSQIVH